VSGFFLSQLAVAVLGVGVITSEYATGSIHTALAAAPQCGTVLAAKAAVFGTVAAVTGIASSALAFLAGQAIQAGKGLGNTHRRPWGDQAGHRCRTVPVGQQGQGQIFAR